MFAPIRLNLCFVICSLVRNCALALAFAMILMPHVLRAQTFSVLYPFTGGPDGGIPSGGLIIDNAGNLYGATQYGGTANCNLGCGVIFKIDTTGKETVLYSFTGGADGGYPQGSLVQDLIGNLYGTADIGGIGQGASCPLGCGVVFKLQPDGKETVLYSFKGGADGENPDGSLLRDSEGNLYGATNLGGTSDAGAVYRLNKSGKLTGLYDFTGFLDYDGEYPNGGLTFGAGNSLYGTTSFGGASDLGAIFKIDKAGEETVVYNFAGTAGEFPHAGLVRNLTGSLY